MTPHDYLRQLQHGNVNQRACALAFCYAQGSAKHHSLWVIDQMVRQLAGAGYAEFVQMYEQMWESKWETGVAP